MKAKLNPTSLLLGAILGALTTLTIAATTISTQTGTAGRFQLLATDNNVFKIDTATGQVWRTYATHDLGNFAKPNAPKPAEVEAK